MSPTDWKVLSIQSHVVHGYVGNKSATFPLQLLGFEVDALNSVQLSNHRGYKHSKGQILRETELAELFDGLRQNDVLKYYTHLLTGYTLNATFLREIVAIVKSLREANPSLIYVCDPVLGDNGRIYVPQELVTIYKNEIISMADILTPNQFEVELLTEQTITTEEDLWAATKILHDKGVKIVVVSSSNLGSSNNLKAFLSIRDGSKFSIEFPKLGDGTDFTGTGDLFAALLLAHNALQSDPVKAFELTISTVQSVIKNTIKHVPDVTNGTRKLTWMEKELKLIQSRKLIENPTLEYKARPE